MFVGKYPAIPLKEPPGTMTHLLVLKDYFKKLFNQDAKLIFENYQNIKRHLSLEKSIPFMNGLYDAYKDKQFTVNLKVNFNLKHQKFINVLDIEPEIELQVDEKQHIDSEDNTESSIENPNVVSSVKQE